MFLITQARLTHKITLIVGAKKGIRRGCVQDKHGKIIWWSISKI
jgi:hypothetical protein